MYKLRHFDNIPYAGKQWPQKVNDESLFWMWYGFIGLVQRVFNCNNF